MRSKLIFLMFYISLAFVFGGCSFTSFYKFSDTQASISHVLQDSIYSHMQWGILIESMEHEEILYQINANKLFLPASNQKIITAATALHILKPDYTYQTKLYYSGEIVDSILIGDLVIEGNGDPSLTRDFYSDPRQMFISIADTLKSWGVKKITGNIIGDDNSFDDIGLGNGWMLEDLKYSFASELGALQINNNSVSIEIHPPARSNDHIVIIPDLNSSYYKIFNDLTVSSDSLTRIDIERPIGSNDIYLSGIVQVGSPIRSKTISLTNSTLFYLTVFKETLIDNGVEVEGIVQDCDDIENWHLDENKLSLITKHNSPILLDLLKFMMKESNNLQAETLIRSLGIDQNMTGSFENGKKVVQMFLLDMGIQPEDYAFYDGSGLSRYNLISPEQIVNVLKGSFKTEERDLWMDTIPVRGNYDEFNNLIIRTKDKGNIRAKTGTMSNIRCLSGYIELPGDTIVFSFMVNGHLLKTWEIDLLIDRILVFILNGYKDKSSVLIS
ncbi:D-alanyl-D-alanine carboxypeptidase/D-alanyl-D-alanine-endopeptidase [Candidatus Cloacimonadota bacterium]